MSCPAVVGRLLWAFRLKMALAFGMIVAVSFFLLRASSHITMAFGVGLLIFGLYGFFRILQTFRESSIFAEKIASLVLDLRNAPRPPRPMLAQAFRAKLKPYFFVVVGIPILFAVVVYAFGVETVWPGVIMGSLAFFGTLYIHDESSYEIENHVFVRRPWFFFFFRNRTKLDEIRAYRRTTNIGPGRNGIPLQFIEFYDAELNSRFKICSSFYDVSTLEQWASNHLRDVTTVLRPDFRDFRK